ncbi:Protein kinase [Mollivirus sibericum]|uniref:Protein kinase n=1 Tax=Mollivirus sibericum TaxID=1678078 RepID=UPI0006B2E299|nr:Protein kinase [Mollivirus sibericum]ALD62179.1 Protein kinase [Mollivirus sibericum]
MASMASPLLIDDGPLFHLPASMEPPTMTSLMNAGRCAPPWAFGLEQPEDFAFGADSPRVDHDFGDLSFIASDEDDAGHCGGSDSGKGKCLDYINYDDDDQAWRSFLSEAGCNQFGQDASLGDQWEYVGDTYQHYDADEEDEDEEEDRRQRDQDNVLNLIVPAPFVEAFALPVVGSKRPFPFDRRMSLSADNVADSMSHHVTGLKALDISCDESLSGDEDEPAALDPFGDAKGDESASWDLFCDEDPAGALQPEAHDAPETKSERCRGTGTVESTRPGEDDPIWSRPAKRPNIMTRSFSDPLPQVSSPEVRSQRRVCCSFHCRQEDSFFPHLNGFRTFPRVDRRQENEIEKGSYGTILGVKLKAFAKSMVVKSVQPACGMDIMATAMREVHMALGLAAHPAIASAGMARMKPKTCDILMERMEGSLRKLLMATPQVRRDNIGDVALQVCSALAYIHAQGIVHRDIKMDNILYAWRQCSGDKEADRDEGTRHHLTVKLTDFGISRYVGSASQQTLTGNVVTLYYKPPELLHARMPDNIRQLLCKIGKPERVKGETMAQDFRSQEAKKDKFYNQSIDTWAFGVVLLELILGESSDKFQHFDTTGHGIVDFILSAARDNRPFGHTEPIFDVPAFVRSTSIAPGGAKIIMGKTVANGVPMAVLQVMAGFFKRNPSERWSAERAYKHLVAHLDQRPSQTKTRCSECPSDAASILAAYPPRTIPRPEPTLLAGAIDIRRLVHAKICGFFAFCSTDSKHETMAMAIDIVDCVLADLCLVQHSGLGSSVTPPEPVATKRMAKSGSAEGNKAKNTSAMKTKNAIRSNVNPDRSLAFVASPGADDNGTTRIVSSTVLPWMVDKDISLTACAAICMASSIYDDQPVNPSHASLAHFVGVDITKTDMGRAQATRCMLDWIKDLSKAPTAQRHRFAASLIYQRAFDILAMFKGLFPPTRRSDEPLSPGQATSRARAFGSNRWQDTYEDACSIFARRS